VKRLVSAAQDLHETENFGPAPGALREVARKYLFHLGAEFPSADLITEEIKKCFSAIPQVFYIHSFSRFYLSLLRVLSFPGAELPGINLTTTFKNAVGSFLTTFFSKIFFLKNSHNRPEQDYVPLRQGRRESGPSGSGYARFRPAGR
jgi:hypothetical protein